MEELDRAVRPARWGEYVGLARLVARRMAESSAAGGRFAALLHHVGLWLAALSTFVGYGALTTAHRQAVASCWVLDDDDWRLLRRALPAIAVLGAAELTLFAVSPPWVPVVVAGLLSLALFRLWRRWRSRRDLRRGRRRGAVYIANLVSARKGAGRVVLDHIASVASAEGRFTCLEVVADPGLLAYYAQCGYVEVRRVDVGRGHAVVYMERPPDTEGAGL